MYPVYQPYSEIDCWGCGGRIFTVSLVCIFTIEFTQHLLNSRLWNTGGNFKWCSPSADAATTLLLKLCAAKCQAQIITTKQEDWIHSSNRSVHLLALALFLFLTVLPYFGMHCLALLENPQMLVPLSETSCYCLLTSTS